MDVLKKLQEPNYWLLAIGVTLAALHLTLLDQAKQENLFGISVLLWLGIASLIWDKKDELPLKSTVFPTVFGCCLIALILLRSISPAGYHLRFSPLMSGVGLVLIASGFKGIRYYWKELTILSLLIVDSIFSAVLSAVKLPLWTANFSSAVMWTVGYPVRQDGVFIILPTGKVEVYGACSGIELMSLMFTAALLFNLLFDLKRIQQIVSVVVAVLVGFFVNSVRVGIMAALVAYSDMDSFEYWHSQDGSLIFAVVAIALFGVFCWVSFIRTFQNQSPE